jgi:hypothetical protein
LGLNEKVKAKAKEMEIISESEESQASVEPEKKKHTPFFNYIEAKKEKKKAYRH